MVKESFEPKKLLILRIMEIFYEHSDFDHRLKQTDIIHLLKSIYNIECDRKAVARNIDYLQRAGIDIVSERSGSYLRRRKFENGELRLLIDSVLVNKNISKKQTEDLIERLKNEGGKYFKSYTRHIIVDKWPKLNKPDYFLNIETICDAIDKQLKIEFYYLSYGIDKKLSKRDERLRIASPYSLMLKNGFYYLLCNYEEFDNMVCLRVDRMKDISVTENHARDIKTIPGYENGMDLGAVSNRLPYAFDDKPSRIEFVIGKDLINDVVDWFGTDFDITVVDENRVRISLSASERAMRFWILQFGKYIKVLSPISLVNQIKDDIIEMSRLYNL